jgi:hypothetical protein
VVGERLQKVCTVRRIHVGLGLSGWEVSHAGNSSQRRGRGAVDAGPLGERSSQPQMSCMGKDTQAKRTGRGGDLLRRDRPGVASSRGAEEQGGSGLGAALDAWARVAGSEGAGR